MLPLSQNEFSETSHHIPRKYPLERIAARKDHERKMAGSVDLTKGRGRTRGE
jgi:hypothetical protein